MSHRFGDLLSQHLHRKHGLSQARLAAGILQEPSIVTQMCKGQRLTGHQARERVLAMVAWLHAQGVLNLLAEANALLGAAGMAGLDADQPAERVLLNRLEAASVAAPPTPALTIRNRQLPVPPTALIGREQELADIVRCLKGSACRLLNLVGLGGSGKTRLAIEAATIVADHFRHGVAWVNLQPVWRHDAFAVAVADALGVQSLGNDTPSEQVLNYLHNKALLLVLDNFEQLIPTANLLVELLAHAPSVTVLATSREVIRLQVEWLYPVSGLGYPPPVSATGDVPAWSSIEAYAAVQLFVARARQVQPAFQPAAHGVSIARICQLTAGMPLALEIAASWITTLTCAEIADELAVDLAALNSKMRDVPERHRTMRAVFDQSWNRLGGDEQRTFRQLAVFRGGFRREAAEQVADATLSVLSTLVDHSLVLQDADGRYQMHELLRQYGEARLAESALEPAQTQARHGAYYTGLMDAVASAILSGNDFDNAVKFIPEVDNVRSALRWAIEGKHAEAIRRAAIALHWLAQIQGRYREGLALYSSAIQALSADHGDETVAGALIECHLYAGWLAIRLGHLDQAVQAANQSLYLQRSSGIQPTPGWGNNALGVLSLVATLRGDHATAAQLATEVYQTSKAVGAYWSVPNACYTLAQAFLAEGELDGARATISEAVAVCRRYRIDWFEGHCLITLGEICLMQADLMSARQHFQDALDIWQRFGDSGAIAQALNHLGEVALHENEIDAAEVHFRESLVHYEGTNDLGGMATSYQGLGRAAFQRGDIGSAARCYQQALHMAVASSFVPLIISLLTQTAALSIDGGDSATALTLLTFVSSSANSRKLAREDAQNLANQLRATASAAEFDRAWRHSPRLTLKSTIATAEEKLALLATDAAADK